MITLLSRCGLFPDIFTDMFLNNQDWPLAAMHNDEAPSAFRLFILTEKKKQLPSTYIHSWDHFLLRTWFTQHLRKNPLSVCEGDTLVFSEDLSDGQSKRIY